MFVQAFVSKFSVECILVGLSGPNKCKANLILEGPSIHGLAGELRAVVDDDCFWQASLKFERFEDSCDAKSGY